MTDPANDPFLVAMQQQTAGLSTILKRIDELEAVINKLFARMQQIEANHERLFRALPSTPSPPPPSVN
jgi:hypothetical protein